MKNNIDKIHVYIPMKNNIDKIHVYIYTHEKYFIENSCIYYT